MKTSITSTTTYRSLPLLCPVSAFLIALAALAALAANARAQLFVTQAVGFGPAGVVSEYNTQSRQTPVLPNPLITGLSGPLGLVLTSKNDALFVSNNKTGVVGKYDLPGGGADSSFTPITGLKGVMGVAVSNDGKTLYVASFGKVTATGSGTGTVGTYDAKSGAVINASFLSNLSGPTGLAIQGGVLYVALFGNMFGTGSVGAFDTEDAGEFNNGPLITGLNQPVGLALSGNSTLYVVNEGNGTIGKYKITGNVTVDSTNSNPTFIQNLNAPSGVALLGQDLFVVLTFGGAVAEYDVSGSSGVAFDTNFVTGLQGPAGIAIK
jgi:hypothetical protein